MALIRGASRGDTSFDPPLVLDPNASEVTTVLQQADGKLLLTGTFSVSEDTVGLQRPA
ncbi:MAG: hypothetical protein N2037_02060 [Acidimicrobiales bacterium]|nr:hypothetical protein [Acidimicrobiales bacterium]